MIRRLALAVLNRTALSIALGLVLLVGVTELVVWQIDSNRRTETEKRLLSRLVDARALLEAEVSEGIYITIGLESFIQSEAGQPDFDQIESWMESLFGHTRHLRNIGIAPDNRISAVYPRQGNEDVIGVRYRDVPEQWPEVQKLMDSGEALLVGPIDLIQGGRGLIYRRPVFVEGEYWGLISTVMRFSSILGVIEDFTDPESGQYRLSKQTPDRTEVIAGELEGAPMVSQSLRLDFPGGLQWRMTMGEEVDTAPLWLARGILWGLGLIFGFSAWQWVHSSRIARESEKRSMKERTEFIHSVSHELRSPLTFIRGAIGMLEQANREDPRQASLLALANRNVARLQRLVDEVLDLARLDGSRMELNLKPEALEELVRQAVENNEYYAGQHELALRVESEPGAETVMIGVDRERFLQIMDNLLSNAIKFSDPGQTVRVRVGSRPGWGEVSVIDEGAGIPASFRSRIFDRFAKADTTDKRRNQSGTGLGLSLVHELVAAMDGEITLESEEGRGTTVTIRFPLLQH